MFDLLRTIFSAGRFEPHNYHFFDTPGAMWLSVWGNLFSFLAYLFIPVVIIYFIRKRKDLYLNWMVLLFGAFIFLCGLTHGIHALIFWYPAYYLQAVINTITFIVSFATAVALLYFLPIIVRLVSPKQMEEANKKLSDEAERSKKNIEELARKNAESEMAAKNLFDKNDELEKLNRFMAGRENVIAELENKISDLKKNNG